MFTPSKFSASVALGLAASLVACGGGGGSSSPAAAPLTLSLPSSYVLKWSDEFSTDGAPSAAWTYDLGAPLLGGTVWGNNEQEFYTQDSANVYVSAGQLTIQPVAGLPSGAPTNLNLLASSARIKTDTSTYYAALNGTPYGFYEIRAKVPCLRGAWPAIWMMGRDGVWPDRGEIDIMEWLGRYFTGFDSNGRPIDMNQVQSGFHTKNNYGETSFYKKADVSTMCSAYHNFQMHWTASEIVIGVDGVKTYSLTKPINAGVNDWPFDAPAYLILNVAVGGNLGGTVSTSDIASMAMKVDYVKVWQPH